MGGGSINITRIPISTLPPVLIPFKLYYIPLDELLLLDGYDAMDYIISSPWGCNSVERGKPNN
jgi:hypothetical protein